MSSALANLQEMLASAPLEDAVAALIAARDMLAAEAPEALAELELRVYERVTEETRWRDAKKASRAMRFCLDIVQDHGFTDGNTPTYLLIRAIQLDPDDDALVLEYLYEVADGLYAYKNLSLLDIAQGLPDRQRAQRLALLHTLAEYFILASYLDAKGTDNQDYVAAMQHALRGAIALGGSEASWLAARSWVTGAISFADVPADVYAKYAPKS